MSALGEGRRRYYVEKDYGYLHYSRINPTNVMCAAITSLTALRISGQGADALRADGVQRVIMSLLDNGAAYTLRGLDVSCTSMERVPDEVALLTSLEELRFGVNALERLPVSVCTMQGLRVLHLENTRLQSVPDELGNLTQLQELLIYNNTLTTLPATCSNLTNLLNLNLRGNRIADEGATLLARMLSNHPHLLILDVSNNLIASHWSFGHLGGLIDWHSTLMCVFLQRNPGYAEYASGIVYAEKATDVRKDRAWKAIYTKLAAARDEFDDAFDAPAFCSDEFAHGEGRLRLEY